MAEAAREHRGAVWRDKELHMQKWIRDRMRRRKKKTGPDGTPATDQNPPLQPAYPESASGTDDSEDMVVNDAAADEAANTAAPDKAPAKKAAKKSPRRRKKRKPEQAAGEASEDEASQEISPAVAPLTPRGSEMETEAAAEPVAAHPEPVPAASEPPAVVPTLVEPHPVPAQTAAPVPSKPQRASKGAVVLAVGLPGSGKSTWFNRHGVSPLSSDKVRELLFDNPTEQRHQDLVFGTLRSLLRARLIARMPMNYVDATNLSPKERRHWIKMAKDFGYEAQAVYFDVPLDVCMERNQRRNRVVPEDVMNRMGAKLRPPTFDEGFSKIVVVRVKQKTADKSGRKDQSAGQNEAKAETE